MYRSHQEHVIDPLWCEQTQETKSSIYNALKAAENVVKDNTINFKEFEYLQATHFNAWTGKEVQPILSGKPDFKSTGKLDFILELATYRRMQKYAVFFQFEHQC